MRDGIDITHLGYDAPPWPDDIPFAREAPPPGGETRIPLHLLGGVRGEAIEWALPGIMYRAADFESGAVHETPWEALGEAFDASFGGDRGPLVLNGFTPPRVTSDDVRHAADLLVEAWEVWFYEAKQWHEDWNPDPYGGAKADDLIPVLTAWAERSEPSLCEPTRLRIIVDPLTVHATWYGCDTEERCDCEIGGRAQILALYEALHWLGRWLADLFTTETPE